MIFRGSNQYCYETLYFCDFSGGPEPCLSSGSAHARMDQYFAAACDQGMRAKDDETLQSSSGAKIQIFNLPYMIMVQSVDACFG